MWILIFGKTKGDRKEREREKSWEVPGIKINSWHRSGINSLLQECKEIAEIIEAGGREADKASLKFKKMSWLFLLYI